MLRRLQYKCFSMKLSKFSRTLFLYGTLLLVAPPLTFLWVDMNDFNSASLHHTLNPQMAYYALLAYFFQCQDKDSRAKPLVIQPYRNWKDAKEDLNSHQWTHLLLWKPKCRIENSISTSSTRVIYQSRKYLSAVMRAI